LQSISLSEAALRVKCVANSAYGLFHAYAVYGIIINSGKK